MSARSPLCEMDPSRRGENMPSSSWMRKRWRWSEGGGFSQLLQCPRCSGVGCHIAVQNPPGLVFDNDQDTEQPKRRRHEDTKVTGQYGGRMIAYT